MRSQSRVTKIVIAGVFSALTILLGLFPSVGLIPVPTPAANATTMHIPAILGGILAGPVVGALVGLSFGVFSFLRATIPMFKDPLVAILPRLFIGVAAWAVYAGAIRASRNVLRVITALLALLGLWFSWQIHDTRPLLGWVVIALVLAAGAGMYLLLRRGSPETIAVAIAAVAGTLTNTTLVLGMASLLGYLPTEGIILIGTTHGIPEAIVAAVIATAVVGAVRGTGGRESSRL